MSCRHGIWHSSRSHSRLPRSALSFGECWMVRRHIAISELRFAKNLLLADRRARELCREVHQRIRGWKEPAENDYSDGCASQG